MFPMKLNQIAKFEKINMISVNVYILELLKQSFQVVPARIENSKLYNLLLIQDNYFVNTNDFEISQTNNEDNGIKYQFCWMKDMSNVLASQLNK